MLQGVSANSVLLALRMPHHPPLVKHALLACIKIKTKLHRLDAKTVQKKASTAPQEVPNV